MDTITQVLNDRAFVIAWYGSCDNEPCQDFELANLTDDTGASALHRVSIIAEVDESHKTWKTFLPVTLSTNELTHFRCGHAYLIFMEDANDTGGVGNIKVPGLVVVDSATTEERLLTDVCGGVASICDGPKESKVCVSGMPVGKEHLNGTYTYFSNPGRGNSIEYDHENSPGSYPNYSWRIEPTSYDGWSIIQQTGNNIWRKDSAAHPDFTTALPSTISIYPWCVDWSAHGITVEQFECSSIPTATISFVNLVDVGDLRIGIEVDLSDLLALCSSNEWEYTIRDSSDTIIHQDVAAGPNSTVMSDFLPLGDETYTVTIWGVSSNGTVLTPQLGDSGEVSQDIHLPWPAPDLFIDPEQVNVSYVEANGPSDFQKFTFYRYLTDAVTIHFGSNGPNWEYRLGTGTWESGSGTTVPVPDDINEIDVRLKQGLPAGDRASATYSSELVFWYDGKDSSTNNQLNVPLNGEVLDRYIEILAGPTDNLDSHATLNVTQYPVHNDRHYYYKVEAPTGQIYFDRSQSAWPPFNVSMTYCYIDLGTYGEGAYKFTVWGVEDINGVWTTITPEEEATVDMAWPDPVFPISGNVNESYVDGDGTSPGNSVLTRTDKWVSSSKFYAPDNSGPVAWEYREFDQTTWQDVPTSLTNAGHRVPNNAHTIAPWSGPSTNITWDEASVHNKFVYRLKEALPVGNYNMDVIYIGESLNGDPDLQRTKQLTGTVQPKPDCCLGFQNTFPTTGDNSAIDPVDNVKVYGFENGGSLCYHDASEGEMKIFDVNLKNSAGQVVGGGAMLVFGALSNPEVIYTSIGEVCYRGNVTSDASMNYLLEE